MTEQYLFEILGKIIAFVASGAGGAFLLMKFWGQKWIENKFSKDLEVFKVQKLHEFDLLLTRKTRWNEVEHEVLSTSWKKLMAAHNALKRSIDAIREFSDLSSMDRIELDKFVERNKFSDSEKEYLLSHDNKNNAYYKILEYRDLSEARKSCLEFHNYLENNSIFLSPDVKEKFSKVDDHIRSAWIDRKLSMGDQKMSFWQEAIENEKENIAPLVTEIELLIQKKLFPEESKD